MGKKESTKQTVQILLVIFAFLLIGGAIFWIGKKSDKPTPSSNDQPAATISTADKASILKIKSDDDIQGSASAPVTIIEYADFQCPYCIQFDTTMQQVMAAYPTGVRWVYRHFPLEFHQNAQISAMAVEAAGNQGKFWEYADLLISKSQADGTGLNTSDLTGYAQSLGLDMTKFSADQNNSSLSDKISSDESDAKKLGIQGTPTSYLIDGKGNISDIAGALSFSDMKAKIDPLLTGN